MWCNGCQPKTEYMIHWKQDIKKSTTEKNRRTGVLEILNDILVNKENEWTQGTCRTYTGQEMNTMGIPEKYQKHQYRSIFTEISRTKIKVQITVKSYLITYMCQSHVPDGEGDEWR